MGNFRLLGRATVMTWKKRTLAVRLWAVNIIFSIFAIGPLFFLMQAHMSHSFSGERALQKLDILWLGDFVYRFMNISPAVVPSALLAAGLYLLLSVFLNGGVIGALGRPEAKTTLGDFYRDCGLNFWRLFRLFLLSIPAYLVFLGIFYSLLKAFLEIFSRRAPTEWPALIVSNLRFLTLVLLLGLVSMFFDYVKIGLVKGGSRKVLRQTWLTLKFLGRRFFKAWGLYLLAGVVFILFTLLYLEVVRILPKNRPLLVLLVFLWQQIYIVGRQASKVLFFASEMELVKQHATAAPEKNREEGGKKE
jgi:hypothetical protein